MVHTHKKKKKQVMKNNYAIYAMAEEGLPRFRSSEWRFDLYSDRHMGIRAYGHTSIRADNEMLTDLDSSFL